MDRRGAPAALTESAQGQHLAVEFNFFKELKRRNMGRVAILYLLLCWLILEPVQMIFLVLEATAWANRLVLILMTIGFPIVLFFAWAYEITPQGLERTAKVDRRQSIMRQTGERLDWAIIAVMALALVYVVVDQFWLSYLVTGIKRSHLGA
jgi:hypothetical protein